MFNTDRAFAFRMVSIPVVAGLLTALWVTAAEAKETKPEYRVPGNCVKTTYIADDGSIRISKSCEYTEAEYARLKRTGK